MAADTYGFTYSEQRTPALQDVTFAAAPGEVILIAGDSGSGKSTLLKSLNGLIPEIVEGRLTGQRFLNDQDMTNLSIDAVSRMVGTVFQNPRSQFFTLDAGVRHGKLRLLPPDDAGAADLPSGDAAHRGADEPGDLRPFQRRAPTFGLGHGHGAQPRCAPL